MIGESAFLPYCKSRISAGKSLITTNGRILRARRVHHRILVVEDRPATLGLLTRLLKKEGFDVIQAGNGEQALEILSCDYPDLVLLDISLSGIDGFDICKGIKDDPLKQHIPVLMCVPKERSENSDNTARPDVFITRPFANSDLIGQIRAQLKIKTLEDRLNLVNRELQKTRTTQVRQADTLEQVYVDTVHCLLAAAEAKDPYIRGHAFKVATIARMIGERMDFDQRSLANLEYAALLHDVGKIGVPLDILSKKGQLEREEMEIIKQHPEISVEIISPVGFLSRILPIIRHHHENIDGTGYPLGLAGEQICLESRVLSVADAYDAMVSDRPYRPAMENWRALEIITERAGTQFDAEVAGVFVQLAREGFLAPVYPQDTTERRTNPVR